MSYGFRIASSRDTKADNGFQHAQTSRHLALLVFATTALSPGSGIFQT
ncbi:hypothetical protein PI125_g10965 [Phytophthora idaei]|nr:hypothetical protein PI125_g10965 [Phytophthora idaei]